MLFHIKQKQKLYPGKCVFKQYKYMNEIHAIFFKVQNWTLFLHINSTPKQHNYKAINTFMNSEGDKKGLGLLHVFTFKNERSMCVYRETVILLHSSPPFMPQTDSSLEHMLSKHLNRMSKGTDPYR